jgi:carbamoyltransferase
MIILGIADNHDSGAAVVADGRLVSAVNQERIDRKKNSGAFPWGAIDSALETAGIRERDVDRIVVGSSFTPSAILRALPGSHRKAKGRGQFSGLLHGYILYQSMLKRAGMEGLEQAICHRILGRRLRKRPFGGARLELMDHHRAHAEGAYRTQARDRCLVLTLDAMGDGTTATAWLGSGGQLNLLGAQSGLAGPNLFYSRITEILGFTPLRHEGKITGLAAQSEPVPKLLEHFNRALSFKNGSFARMPWKPAKREDAFWSMLQSYSREEVAATAQAALEACAMDYVRHWTEVSGCGDIALAGGVFANVRLNQRIAELPEVDSVWIMPHMGDGGLAAGGALGAAGAPPVRLGSACLGPACSDGDILKALKRAGAQKTTSDPMGHAAAALAAGGEIACFQGRMEWGPRALGNRSILAIPSDPDVNDRLNRKLDRSEFMPFAPLVRAEDAGRYFNGLEKAEEASRYMTLCFDTTEAFRRSCPAAVHVDGTARPQILHREDNPGLHRLLGEVGLLTGTPVLINTSFNLHEEPIVCTADEGVRAWKQAGLSGIWAGGYWATTEGQEPA